MGAGIAGSVIVERVIHSQDQHIVSAFLRKAFIYFMIFFTRAQRIDGVSFYI